MWLRISSQLSENQQMWLLVLQSEKSLPASYRIWMTGLTRAVLSTPLRVSWQFLRRDLLTAVLSSPAEASRQVIASSQRKEVNSLQTSLPSSSQSASWKNLMSPWVRRKSSWGQWGTICFMIWMKANSSMPLAESWNSRNYRFRASRCFSPRGMMMRERGKCSSFTSEEGLALSRSILPSSSGVAAKGRLAKPPCIDVINMLVSKYFKQEGRIELAPLSCLESLRAIETIPFLSSPLSVFLDSAVLVTNPASGRASSRSLLESVRRRLSEQGIPVVELTTLQEGGVPLRQVQMSENTVLIIGGGDGTIFQTLTELRRIQPKHRLFVHILPLGTGNDLFNCFRDRYSCKHLCREADAIPFDVGCVHYSNPRNGQRKEVLFCTQVGLALATEVTKLAQNMPYLGALKYKCALYINFFRSTGLRCELWLDGKLVRNGPMKLLQIQNAPKIGGGIKSAPLAQMDDGLLDVVVGYSDSKLKFLNVARKAQEGKHIFDPEVSYYRAREVVLRGEEGIEFMVDGELVEGGEEVRVSLIRDWVYLI